MSSTVTSLDERTKEYGREIFARLNRQGPVLFTRAWVEDKLMGLGMHDPALKVQLFRFVDTLPYLKEPKEVARHLREYLNEAKDELPWWVRLGTKLIPDRGILGQGLAFASQKGAEQMARKFIAGSNVQEAVAAVHQMRTRRLAFTIDLLGEATITEVEADHVQKQYLDLLAGLTREVNDWPEEPTIDRDDRGPIPRVNVSVKLSALFSQFDPIDPAGTSRAVCRRLRPILSLAKQTGAFVNFDMEQHSFKDVTLQIFRDILTEPEFRDWPHVGIAIQAYLTDTEADLHALLAWARDVRKCPVWIRLVKGAYWDYETVVAAQNHWPVPVFTKKWQSDANFEKLTEFLLANVEWLVPAFGSHNIRSISHALAVAEKLGVPPRRYEFQMLYGMADPIKEAIQSLGHRVRIYTPYGQLLPGMAYLVRRLLENSSNDSFLRQGFAEGLAEELLLTNPASNAERGTRNAEPKDTNGTHDMGSAGHAVVEAHGSQAPRSAFKNEPLTDFSVAASRTAMSAALDQVRKELGRTYPIVIDNKPQPVGAVLARENPSRKSEVLGKVGMATVDQANRAVASCLAAFDGWRDTPLAERTGLLRRLAEQFRKRRFELSAWIVLETGKPWRESDADVAEAIDFCEYYAVEMEKLGAPQARDVPGEDNRYFYEPRGVAVVIAPWNFPLAILAGMATAALVAGNTVVLKPAEQSGIIGAKLMECLQAAGAPPGVVNFLPGDGDVIGPPLVQHPDVALIAFTGSLKVALLINEQASKTPGGQNFVKKVIAEMGGKNAVIVDSDADLDEAVKGVVDSAFGYGGQKCSAGSRAIVLDGIYDQFLNRLVEATKSLAVKAADDPGCSLGPVIDAEARDRILKFIEAGKRESRLAHQTDLGALAEQGYFVPPTIFADVPETAGVAQEEIFGPVLSVLRARDLDDALRIANGTKYALTGGCYSRSPSHLEKVKRKFRVGNLYINRKCTGALVDRQPFGGFKLSGIGSKAGGPDYLLQFVLPRTITENQMRRGFAPETAAGE
ncbi:1-pyrroline-5-carboxylate dehydrogenase 1 [Gemmata obscuriglobus]|uniref:L-glutamate gamma-semialdehyde dehydrogenase n=1 Tax=Gemmata obscuriglobus TaxID=114 RepID=A0A2Z3GND3_9BACT|nr:L-glutamate gamma-semialdehyde dehydrogenase [Gemmata obscuriglobus]AWM35729.1 L-glutamate gamma-semialdehyde dehydrogenase [Gemmata obscuriglobus]QEG31738.1 1-pyrroline-5-carboxylate dehydrogenase 1 [Gemmata obscuriglobus]VTS11084.1 delta-1-pyrroline-5-carboxylate dehydrogenase : 1-pyrroline-5 carboxylate dehydrogenase OS=Planctomyces maris DSM 8797 GN=PM8797T_17322 PE=3 SV=1: Pro_dh: Aldedh [Gemmata obscuriglobus UQM 2246]